MMEILVLIIVIMVCIVAHEMGHLAILWICGIGVQGIFFPGMLMEFSEKGIQVKKSAIKMKVFVVPKVKKIDADIDYERYKKFYSLSIIMGPIVNFLLIAFSFIIIIIGTEYQFLPIACIGTNIFILLSCFAENKNEIGDFKALFYFHNDEMFAFSYILSFAVAGEISNNKHIENLAKEYVKEILYDNRYYENILYNFLIMVNSGLWRVEAIENFVRNLEGQNDRVRSEVLKAKISETVDLFFGNKNHNICFEEYYEFFLPEYEGLSGYKEKYERTINRLRTDGLLMGG